MSADSPLCDASILLVDDEAKILTALAAALRTEGHEVTLGAGRRVGI